MESLFPLETRGHSIDLAIGLWLIVYSRQSRLSERTFRAKGMACLAWNTQLLQPYRAPIVNTMSYKQREEAELLWKQAVCLMRKWFHIKLDRADNGVPHSLSTFLDFTQDFRFIYTLVYVRTALPCFLTITDQLEAIRESSMARIICDNGENIQLVQPLAFKLPQGM